LSTMSKNTMQMGRSRKSKLWEVPTSKEEPHSLKYSFAYIIEGGRVISYHDAEGRGDRRHIQGREYPYEFLGLDKLWNDFQTDIQRMRGRKT
jgi:hypothetical protein